MGSKLKPLNQQVMVITGGSSGIGRTTAERAAAEGATVVLVARSEDGLREVCDAIVADGGKADYVVADVGVREDVRRAVETVIERHGGFDTWVNDAGVGVYSHLEEITDEDHERLFQTNYWGVVYGSTEALKHLKTRGGALINIGSISSEMPAPLLSAYTASKHAVKGFTDSLRLELMHQGAPVAVTLIKPSGIDTPFGDHAKNYMDEKSKVPPPAYSPQLVADAILHAAQTPTRMITVGSSGKMMVTLANVLPNLSDKLYAWAFYQTARDKNEPNQGIDALNEASGGGTRRGDQKFVRKTSLYTVAQTHPGASVGVGVGLLAAAAAGTALAVARAPRRAARRLQKAA